MSIFLSVGLVDIRNKRGDNKSIALTGFVKTSVDINVTPQVKFDRPDHTIFRIKIVQKSTMPSKIEFKKRAFLVS